MKRLTGILLFVFAGAFAHAALAAGEHSGGHGKMQGHDMKGGGTSMMQHASRAGAPAKAAQATRTIELDMSEFRFNPERIEVKSGETVLFRVRNTGRIAHELMFGDPAELKDHAEQMRKQPTMAHHDSGGLTLEAGKAGEMAWTFTNAGEFQYACLIPGHFEAGMVGTVVVK